jgi:hypothetical protein
VAASPSPDADPTKSTTAPRRERQRHRGHPTITQKDSRGRLRCLAEATKNDTSRPAESVRVTDVPLTPGGRAYLVERELEQDGNAALQALVADYVDPGRRHGEIPMHVPLGRYLAHIEE